jgi:hypothetical protein
MPFRLTGAAAGSALIAPAQSTTIWEWATLPGERGVDLEDDPDRPGYIRYRVIARDGRVIACGIIERTDEDPQLPALFAAFLARRDPPPAPLKLVQ